MTATSFCATGGWSARAVSTALPKTKSSEMIVGEALGELAMRERRAGGGPVLTLSNIRRGEILNGVNLEMRSGEVLGLWGLMGSGRTELIRSILGLDPMDAGQMTIHDGRGPRAISRAELLSRTAYVTESRPARTGCLSMSRSGKTSQPPRLRISPADGCRS